MIPLQLANGATTMRYCVIFFTLLVSFASAADSYRAVVISEAGDADVLQVITEPALPEPGPGEVRLRVLTASASFTDIMVRKGIYGGIEAELPYPPGYDLVGVVDALGAGVENLALGQRVADLTVWGAYTEYAIRPSGGLVPVPESLPAEEAVVLILSYMTAYQMLYRSAEVKPEQSVLIHGASGAVGTALSQLGRMSGLKMYGTASTAKQDYVAAMGVTPIDYKTEDFVARINQETGGAGVDYVFDAIGAENFARSYSILKADGLLVEYGLYQAALADSSLNLISEFISWQWRELMWSWFPEQERRTTFYSITDMRTAQPQWFKEDLSSLFELASEGTIAPQIWKTLPLEQAAQAHRYIETGQVEGKIVLLIGE
jgi:NADPH:quinone reductase-like Zn-dependent oxidoreductase